MLCSLSIDRLPLRRPDDGPHRWTAVCVTGRSATWGSCPNLLLTAALPAVRCRDSRSSGDGHVPRWSAGRRLAAAAEAGRSTASRACAGIGPPHRASIIAASIMTALRPDRQGKRRSVHFWATRQPGGPYSPPDERRLAAGRAARGPYLAGRGRVHLQLSLIH